jgi:channel protein (hemolysin III family)
VTHVFSSVPRCRPFTEPYDRAELIADAVMHVVGLCFAIVGMISLTAKAGELPILQSASVWVYSVCLAGMFMTSAAYFTG